MGNTVNIHLESIIEGRKEQILASEVGNDLVMMDIENGQYITLNRVARIIWQQIETPISVTELLKALMQRFNVTKEECTNDTLEYLHNMYEQNLIIVR
ncbi:MAG: PqqD family protein [Chitinophagaceae bacterium]|nr:PqqD family protein [Chitinophagaceae bacterium]